MKKLFLFLLASLSAFAQTYIERPLAEKIKDPDLTFFVSFDTRTLNADFARGDRMSTTLPKTELYLRGLVGFDTQQAYKPEAGENLKFNVEKNVDPHQGTLILWTAGLSYNPGDELTDGKKRGNIALAHIVTSDGNRYIDYQLYEYGTDVTLDWRSSEGNQGWGSIGRVDAPRLGIKKGQWHQIAATWDDSKLRIFINGKQVKEAALPQKVNLTKDLVAKNNPQSFIGVKSPFYEDNHTWDVAVDDFAIYSRAMTPLEISNRYIALLKDKGDLEIKDYLITLNGVVTGREDKVDRLEAEFDFAALPDAMKKQLLGKDGLTMKWELLGPEASRQSGTWNFSKLAESKILQGVDKVGMYTLNTTLGDSKISASINRPDFSWVGNKLGDEDQVPDLWKDFAVNGRDITLWNRKYHFGNGPLPTSITCYGKELLKSPPKLLIDGKEPKWKAGETKHMNRLVTYTGEGKLGKATIKYETTVEFDGMILFKWNVCGKPHIDKMEMNWQVAEDNHQFLMTPKCNLDKQNSLSFTYPLTSSNPKMLWFVTEKKGGFAYTLVTDGNWRYDADKPVLFANKATGACRVEMINIPTDMPEDVPYQAVFIATPTRPLPGRIRGLEFGGNRGNGAPQWTHGGGEGYFNSIFTHAPCQDAKAFYQRYKNSVPGTFLIYGGIGALSTYEETANYLRKYWEIPGAYSYKMGFTHKMPDGSFKRNFYFSLSACTSTVYCDFPLWSDQKLYESPLASKFYLSYYDLCGDSICRNKLHGCGYTDKFGRDVATFALLHKRDNIRRLMALAHRNHKLLMLHGQWDYIPAMQGLADFWLPGEQNTGIVQNNPYGHVDDIPDEIYRSEYNRDVIGTGIIMDSAVCQVNYEHFKEPYYKYTEGLLSMSQMHDIEIDRSWSAGTPTYKVWDTLRKYGVQSPETECHLYYEQNEVKSSNPNVRVTYYKCPGDHYVLFIATKEPRNIKTEIDLSQLNSGSFKAIEEYKGNEVNVVNGKFEAKVRARSFQIVCFPPKAYLPAYDDFDFSWSVWQPENCDTDFARWDEGNNSYNVKINRKTANGCFNKTWEIPARTKCVATIRMRQIAGSEPSTVTLTAQPRKGKELLNGRDRKAKITADDQWQTMTVEFGGDEQWSEADSVFILLSSSGQDNTVIFDDFRLDVAK